MTPAAEASSSPAAEANADMPPTRQLGLEEHGGRTSEGVLGALEG